MRFGDLGISAVEFQVWAIGLVGLLAAGAALFVGLRVLRRPVETSYIEDPPDHDPFVHGSCHEKRQALRRKGSLLEILVSDDKAKAAATHGWVLDRSLTGLKLQLEHGPASGTVITIRPLGNERVPWIEVEVVRSQPNREGWEVGCKYLRPPTWTIQMLFG